MRLFSNISEKRHQPMSDQERRDYYDGLQILLGIVIGSVVAVGLVYLAAYFW